jgi:hypothetical protein
MESDRSRESAGGAVRALFFPLGCSGTERGMISHWQDRMGLGASPSHIRAPKRGYRATIASYGAQEQKGQWLSPRFERSLDLCETF